MMSEPSTQALRGILKNPTAAGRRGDSGSVPDNCSERRWKALSWGAMHIKLIE